MDVVLVSGVNARFRRVLRCGAGLDSMDDYRGALLTRPSSDSNGDCGFSQLDGEFLRRNRFSQSQGNNHVYFFPQAKVFLMNFNFNFPQTALENYTFLPFSVFLAIFWIFTYKKVPETKNKTFEEILALFRHGNGR